MLVSNKDENIPAQHLGPIPAFLSNETHGTLKPL